MLLIFSHKGEIFFRCAVPRIFSGIGVLNQVIIAAFISACDGLGFVEETMIFLALFPL